MPADSANFRPETPNISAGFANISPEVANIGTGIANIRNESPAYLNGIAISGPDVDKVGNDGPASLPNQPIALLSLGRTWCNHFPRSIPMAATTPGRIKLPKGPKEIFELATKIHQKHQEDGAASELKNLQDTDWDKVGPTIAVGMGHHAEAERYKGLMEEQYRLRDAILKPVSGANSDTSSYLKGKYKKTPKRLAAWGYEVDDTPPAKSAAAKAKKATK